MRKISSNLKDSMFFDLYKTQTVRRLDKVLYRFGTYASDEGYVEYGWREGSVLAIWYDKANLEVERYKFLQTISRFDFYGLMRDVISYAMLYDMDMFHYK